MLHASMPPWAMTMDLWTLSTSTSTTYVRRTCLFRYRGVDFGAAKRMFLFHIVFRSNRRRAAQRNSEKSLARTSQRLTMVRERKNYIYYLLLPVFAKINAVKSRHFVMAGKQNVCVADKCLHYV